MTDPPFQISFVSTLPSTLSLVVSKSPPRLLRTFCQIPGGVIEQSLKNTNEEEGNLQQPPSALNLKESFLGGAPFLHGGLQYTPPQPPATTWEAQFCEGLFLKGLSCEGAFLWGCFKDTPPALSHNIGGPLSEGSVSVRPLL